MDKANKENIKGDAKYMRFPKHLQEWIEADIAESGRTFTAAVTRKLESQYQRENNEQNAI